MLHVITHYYSQQQKNPHLYLLLPKPFTPPSPFPAPPPSSMPYMQYAFLLNASAAAMLHEKLTRVHVISHYYGIAIQEAQSMYLAILHPSMSLVHSACDFNPFCLDTNCTIMILFAPFFCLLIPYVVICHIWSYAIYGLMPYLAYCI